MPPLLARVAVFMRGKVSPPEAFTASTAASRSLLQGGQQFPYDISVLWMLKRSAPGNPCLKHHCGSLPPTHRCAEESVFLKLNMDFMSVPK